MPWGRVEVSVLSLAPFPISPPHVLPYLLQVEMVLGMMWEQFGTPAKSKQGCSTWHPSSFTGVVFDDALAVIKQLEGKNHTALWITETCHSIVGSHCRTQSSTWLGQELLLSEVVQLMWGPHLAPCCQRTGDPFLCQKHQRSAWGYFGTQHCPLCTFLPVSLPWLLLQAGVGWVDPPSPPFSSPSHQAHTEMVGRGTPGSPSHSLLNRPCHPRAAGAAQLTFLHTSSLGFPQYNAAH